MQQFWHRLGFGGRLTFSMLALFLSAILLLSSVLFLRYQSSLTTAITTELNSTAKSNAQAFTDWLLVRQEEMRLLATLPYVQKLDLALSTELMLQLAENSGFYDTIFIVGLDGIGMAGVSYSQGQTRILTAAENAAFNVADRAWFQQARGGQNVFSQPIVSRATGQTVSTVAIPIRANNQIIAVMRGAVQLETIFNKVNDLSRNAYTEIYLLDSQGKAITPAASVTRDSVLTTQAALAAQQQQSGVGLYPNANQEPVIGSYQFIPMLGWSLVLESRQQEALAEVRQVFWTLVITTIVILILVAIVCYLLVRQVTRTLGGEPDYAARVVQQMAEGDLSQTIQLPAADQTSLLADIARMQQRLRQMLAEVTQYAEQVATAATELAQINQQTSQGMALQNTEINSAAVAMNEMTATLEEVSRNTQQAATAATHAEQQSDEGQGIVRQTINELAALSEQVSRTAGVIRLLKQDSDQIGNILQVIESIAEQTNLLALNAAIEAARAGESGRGFAVVADEVRTLASRTKDSTTEIKHMIDKLQQGTEQAVKITLSNEQSAKTTAAQAAQADQALRNIYGAVELISNTTQQIATATEQQTVVSRHINQNFHKISDVAYQTNENVSQSALASNSLSGLAEQLQSLVKRFRL